MHGRQRLFQLGRRKRALLLPSLPLPLPALFSLLSFPFLLLFLLLFLIIARPDLPHHGGNRVLAGKGIVLGVDTVGGQAGEVLFPVHESVKVDLAGPRVDGGDGGLVGLLRRVRFVLCLFDFCDSLLDGGSADLVSGFQRLGVLQLQLGLFHTQRADGSCGRGRCVPLGLGHLDDFLFRPGAPVLCAERPVFHDGIKLGGDDDRGGLVHKLHQRVVLVRLDFCVGHVGHGPRRVAPRRPEEETAPRPVRPKHVLFVLRVVGHPDHLVDLVHRARVRPRRHAVPDVHPGHNLVQVGLKQQPVQVRPLQLDPPQLLEAQRVPLDLHPRLQLLVRRICIADPPLVVVGLGQVL